MTPPARLHMSLRRHDAELSPSILRHLARLRLRLYTVRVRIALAQINPTVGDFSGNSAKIIDYSLRAKSAGVDLVLFPGTERLRLSAARPGRAPVVRRAQPPGCGRDCPPDKRNLRDLRSGHTGELDDRKVGLELRRPASRRQDCRHSIEAAVADLRRLRRDAQLRSRRQAGRSSTLTVLHARSPSAKTPGTTRTSGTAACTASIRWKT